MHFASLIKSTLIVCVIGLSACGGGGGDDGGGTGAPAKLRSIQVKASRTSLEAGASVELQAIGTFSDGTAVDLNDSAARGGPRFPVSISWKVSDTSIAEVGSGETLRTSKVGSVIVTATDFFSEISGSANFAVTEAIPTSLEIRGFDSGKSTYSGREARRLSARIVYSRRNGVRSSLVAATGAEQWGQV